MDLTPLLRRTDSTIVLVVMDGLGGYADAEHDSELEEAHTPHLDGLAAEGSTGLVMPVGPGVTPGSGPGHLALFGYDPLAHELGRGVLEAVGVEFDLRPGDVAARGNLCTLDDSGIVVDRRAGRISDRLAQPLVKRLQDEVRVDGVELFFRHVAEHRVLLVLRAGGLDGRVSDTDPQHEGMPLLSPEAAASRRSAPRRPSSRCPSRRARRCGARPPTACCCAGSTGCTDCRASPTVMGCGRRLWRSTRCTAAWRNWRA